MEEQVVQRLSRRCPYCDEVLPGDGSDARGVREERCPHCGRVFIRMPLEEAARKSGKRE